MRKSIMIYGALLSLAGVVAGGVLLLRHPTAAPSQEFPPVEVSVYKVIPTAVTIKDTLPGRVAAFRTAEIRPQVSGIVKKRLFEQGTEVKEGQVLFQLDPALFNAEEKVAEASLKRAEATLAHATTQANRLKTLIDANTISRQSYDNAVLLQQQAEANVAEAKATLDRKRLDVEYASITSPISGRIDQALLTEGALVTAGDTNSLATVQQIDQVFVDVKQPEARLEKLREAAGNHNNEQGAVVDILSANGRVLNVKGKLLFSGISVDPATGHVLARVQVSNPDRLLLPGMYVMASLPRLALKGALMVPQQAVRRDALGNAQVYAVDEKGNFAPMPVTAGEVHEGWYIINAGLKGGEQIIVEGHDRLMPQTPVKPVEWQASSPTSNSAGENAPNDGAAR